MRILHVYNRHRGGGGADNAWDATIRISLEHGLDVHHFERSSLDIAPGISGRVNAFLSGLYARRSVAQFAEKLESVAPDIVHAHELYPLISPWVLRQCSQAGIPVIFTFYDYRLTCPTATHYDGTEVCHSCLGGREYNAVLKNCRNNIAESIAFAARHMVARKFRLFTANISHYIAISEFSKRWLIDKVGVPEHKISINPFAIVLPKAPVDPRGGKYVAFAGRFVPEKGIDILIEAARRTNLPLRLAGASPPPTSIGKDEPIEFVNPRTPDELAEFYRGARMLVIPSLWYETFGIVAGEAMSHGIPVVASRIGALQDTIEDGVTGLHYDTHSPEDLAAKIRNIWEDDALCARLGQQARKKVEEDYSEAAHARRLLGTYEELFKSSSAI